MNVTGDDHPLPNALGASQRLAGPGHQHRDQCLVCTAQSAGHGQEVLCKWQVPLGGSMEVPQAGWCIRENPIEVDDLGVLRYQHS